MSKTFFLILLAIFGVTLFAHPALAQWVPPTDNPPTCANCLTPVNTSSAAQIKEGPLEVNGFKNIGYLLLQIGGATSGMNGKVLTANDTGNATWQTPSGGGGGSGNFWDRNATNGYLYPTTWQTDKVGIGTNTPNNLFQVKDLINFPDIPKSTYIGVGAGSKTTGLLNEQNTAVGYQSLFGNASPFNSGDGNAALGARTLASNTTGRLNTAVGLTALELNTTASNNVAVGAQALRSNLGVSNTAVGSSALYNNTTGTGNTGIGLNALVYNVNGSSNTSLGYAASQNNLSGFGNTVVGASAAGSSLIPRGYSFSENSILGEEAGYNISTGSKNVLMGYKAGEALDTGSNNIVIGYDIDAPSATGNNQLSIGNLIYGAGVDGANTTSSTGSIGIGALPSLTATGAKLQVPSGGLQLNLNAAVQPSCDNATGPALRGEFWFKPGSGGTADIVQVCIRTGSGQTYTWKTVSLI